MDNMDLFVSRCNIDKFTAMLAVATDPMDICTLELLLMEEKQHMREMIASARRNPRWSEAWGYDTIASKDWFHVSEQAPPVACFDHFGDAADAVEPGESPFKKPSAGQQDKAHPSVRSIDDFDRSDADLFRCPF